MSHEAYHQVPQCPVRTLVELKFPEGSLRTGLPSSTLVHISELINQGIPTADVYTVAQELDYIHRNEKKLSEKYPGKVVAVVKRGRYRLYSGVSQDQVIAKARRFSPNVMLSVVDFQSLPQN
jgi:hypothetical protein